MAGKTNAVTQSLWEHDGPSGIDQIEEWTMAGSAFYIVKDRGTFYRLAYVSDGSPAGGTSDYPEYETLEEAQDAWARL